MKTTTVKVLFMLFYSLSNTVFAQGPPDPGGSPVFSSPPLGGGAPIGNGTIILLSFVILYGLKKLIRLRKQAKPEEGI